MAIGNVLPTAYHSFVPAINVEAELENAMAELEMPHHIEILVRDLGGASHSFSVDPTSTFQELAESVYEDGVPEGLRFLFQSKQVVLSQSIDSAGSLFSVFLSSLFLFRSDRRIDHSSPFVSCRWWWG